MSAYSVIFGKRFLPNSRPPTFPHGPERLGPLERPGGGRERFCSRNSTKKERRGEFPRGALGANRSSSRVVSDPA